MSRHKISQREARRLKAENTKLHNERDMIFRRAAGNYPGVNIDTIAIKSEEYWIVATARKLGHAVCLVEDASEATSASKMAAQSKNMSCACVYRAMLAAAPAADAPKETKL